MKKKTLLIAIICIFSILNTFAQRGKCPRGTMYNCPGLCGKFIDNNGDGFCDYSIVEQNNKENDSDTCHPKEDNTETIQLTENTDATDNSTSVNNNSTNEEVSNPEEENLDTSKTVNTIEEQECEEEQKESDYPNYPLFTIALLTLIPYFFTNLLVVFGKMKRKIHRKIWNYILLITFTVAGLLGLFLVLQINYGWMMDNYLANLNLHVKFGISMAIISIIHIIWHWKYYLKRKNDTNC